MNLISIDNKIISPKNPFVIAEVGVNHNGDINLAKKLIDIAKEIGVDAIKFQTYKTEDLVTANAKMADYQKNNLGVETSQLEMLKKLELSYSSFTSLKEYCDKKNILFLSTPHTEDAVDFLDDLMPAYKIGSGDLNNIPLLKKIAKKNKPIILSTGMSYLSEIKESVDAISYLNNKLIILHCTTTYPCPLKDVNLNAMLTMMNELNFPIGYSDHTLGIKVPLMAVSLGAAMIEKHFTLDKNLPGPDHSASATPDEMLSLVKRIRSGDLEKPTEEILGSFLKEPTEVELENKKIVRKSLIADRDILKGEKISLNDIIIKRPGSGIDPKYLDKICGKKVLVDIKKDDLIEWKNLDI